MLQPAAGGTKALVEEHLALAIVGRDPLDTGLRLRDMMSTGLPSFVVMVRRRPDVAGQLVVEDLACAGRSR